MDGYTELAREALGFRWMDEVRGDLRYAARGFRRNPGFTLASIAILALAIGANAAFFTLFSNYALRPLPIRDPQRHYLIEGRDAQARRMGAWTPEEMARLQQAGREVFEGIYSFSGLLQVSMTAPSQRPSMVMAVSPEFFTVLGGTPAQGRLFTEQEARTPLAVLSDAGWRRLFPHRASPVGQTLRIRSTVFTVIGVMPSSFTGIEAAVPDLWVAPGVREALRDGIGDRQAVAGLLRPNVRPARAEAVLASVAAAFVRPGEEPPARVNLVEYSTYLGPDSDDFAEVALMLFATFLTLLLIACANLANLFLARTAARGSEIAMRFALGASRGRIIRQLLTESTLLSMTGAALGAALGTMVVGRVHTWLFSLATSGGAMVLPLTVDWRPFSYAILLGIGAGYAFGLLPALDATADVKRKSRRLRGVLLGAQVAASVILLILAGVLVRNIQRLDSLQTGYDLQRIFDLHSEPASERLIAALGEHPAVAAITAVARVPLYGPLPRQTAHVGGQVASVSYNVVDEHYFTALQLRLQDGRGFYRSEAVNSAPVAVVSQSAAVRLWPGGRAIGKRLQLTDPDTPVARSTSYEVIGVAPDVVNGWLFEGPEPAMVYLPGAAGSPAVRSVMVRVKDADPALLREISEACLNVPGSPGCEPRSLREIAAFQRFPFQAGAAVAGLLGLLALMLTAVGLYSVVSYSVEQRRKEIGVVIALGASPRLVAQRVLGDTGRCVAGGLAVGLPVSVGLSWLAAASVVRIRTFDPLAYATVPALLAVVAAVACLVPVLRALRVDPIAVLRQE
jgi:predicted permease